MTAAVHPAARTTTGLTDGARSILGRRLYAVLGTQNDDATPHLVPAMFLYDNDQILIETGAATRKARNVAAQGHASVLVHTPDAAWVIGTGPATIAAPGEGRRLHDRIRAKYLTPEGRRACGGLLDEIDDVTIVVTPTRWLRWDLAAFMGALGARGVDPTDAESWFLADD
jgi:hypothetical protein